MRQIAPLQQAPLGGVQRPGVQATSGVKVPEQDGPSVGVHDPAALQQAPRMFRAVASSVNGPPDGAAPNDETRTRYSAFAARVIESMLDASVDPSGVTPSHASSSQASAIRDAQSADWKSWSTVSWDDPQVAKRYTAECEGMNRYQTPLAARSWQLASGPSLVLVAAQLSPIAGEPRTRSIAPPQASLTGTGQGFGVQETPWVQTPEQNA